MKPHILISRLLVLSAITFLTACGGGGGGGSAATVSNVEFSSFSVADGSAPKNIAFSWAVDDATNVDEFVLLENADGSSGFTEVARADGSATSLEYELSVHLTDWINAEYMLEARSSSDAEIGSSNEVNLTQALSTQATGYLKNPVQSESNDGFGIKLALSGDGSTLALSDRKDRVYVFSKRPDNSWGETYTVVTPNASGGDIFTAYNIALSHDGTTLAIGASFESSNGTGVNSDAEGDDSVSESGAAFVFVKAGEDYVQQAYIKASNAESGDRFGSAVALSKNGDLLVVGAISEDSGIAALPSSSGATDSGAVYAFERKNDMWEQEAYIKATDIQNEASFGNSVAITETETERYIAVGAELEDGVASNSGAVYVYVYGGLSGWTPQNQYRITARNADEDDRFGGIIALSDDARTLAVGASYESGDGVSEDSNAVVRSGAAYVFSLQSGSYGQSAYIKASNLENNDLFGTSLDLSGDGKTLAVGAYQEGSTATGINGNQLNNEVFGAGAAYVFKRSGNSWTQQSYVKPTAHVPIGSFLNLYFGLDISLSSDGSILVVNAPLERSNAIGVDGDAENTDEASAGAVYLY